MAAKKYQTLDGLRGIAALAVVFYHMPPPLHRVATHGYLAVDLFFLMSGFVVAAAYEQRLVEGWSVSKFLLVRLKRLWPLYALGVAVGVACFAFIRILRPEAHFAFPPMSLASAVILSLFFAPQLIAYGGPAFPFNSASWSLSVELVGNLAYGALVRFIHNRLLVVVICLGLCGLAIIALKSNSLDAGVTAGHVLPGYLRFLFSFPLGVLLFRWHSAGTLPALRAPAWLPLVVTTVALVGLTNASALADVLVVAILFPVILCASLSENLPAGSAKLLAWAGALSYPLYILHPPLIQFVVVLMRGSVPSVVLALLLIALVAAAALAEKYFDGPLQKWLQCNRVARQAVSASAGS